LRPHAEEFAQAGARLVVIGNGWPAMAKAFAERTGFSPSVTLLTDPGRESYRLAGFKRSVLLTLGPHAWFAAVRALLRGFRQGRFAGDAWQQGGTLVVAPGGKVLFRHVSLAPGHHASPGSLLRAVTGV
jgi:hypothetical protein